MIHSKTLKSIGILLALLVFFSSNVVAMSVYKVNVKFKNHCNIKVKNEVTLEKQLIGITSLSNVRQLGGYITKDGRKIKDGVLIRSGILNGASDIDMEILKNKYNLSKVIDFRDELERDYCWEPSIDGVTSISLPIQYIEDVNKEVEVNKILQSCTTLDEYADALIVIVRDYNIINENTYKYLVESEKTQTMYHQFFKELINNKKGSVLFHCTSGKDRTGLAAVFLLYALGVDEETIMDDFELSNDVFKAKADYITSCIAKKTNDREIIERAKIFIGVSRYYMKKAFEDINNKYGSMDLYLKNQIGLTKNDIKVLRKKYLEKVKG